MGNAEFSRVSFEASSATRRSEWASVIIYSILLFLILCMAGFLLVDVKLGIDLRRMTWWWLPSAGVPLGISLIVGYLWSRSRCRFSLVLAENRLEAEPLCAMYDDVDQVNLYVGDLDAPERSSTLVEITCRGWRTSVRIDPSQRTECATLLRQRCRNAMIVDEPDYEKQAS